MLSGLFAKRNHLFELHDFPWCPRIVRDGLTDFLQTFIDLQDIYAPVRSRLLEAIALSRSNAVVDLCSGAGGPWIKWLRDGKASVQVTLTDKFPNGRAQETLASSPVSGVKYLAEPVDATAVPANLVGFRTIFTAFHHLTEGQARGVIDDAVRTRQGIAVLEFTRRRKRQMFEMLLTPFGLWLLTPRIPGVGLGALLLTYVLPLIPLVTCIDGVLSCLRSYTPAELQSLGNAAGYQWHSGEEGGIVYLIGFPSTYQLGPLPGASTASMPADASMAGNPSTV